MLLGEFTESGKQVKQSGPGERKTQYSLLLSHVEETLMDRPSARLPTGGKHPKLSVHRV